MTRKQLTSYISAAQSIMNDCSDPVHDISHARRVANFALRLASEYNISDSGKSALQIAAWWHDVSRSKTQNPSLIWMPFVDDLWSSILLLLYSLRHGTHTPTVGLAVRLIACKSLGTGAVLSKILITRKNRVLIDILKDADALDTIDLERLTQVLKLAETSRLYHHGYKIMWRWFTWGKHARMRTKAAAEYIIEMLRQFVAWLRQPHIFDWHIQNFGKKWTKKSLRRLERLTRKLERQLLLAASV